MSGQAGLPVIRPMIRRALALLAGALLALGAVTAQAQTFPPLTGPVVDGADILPPDVEARLTEKLFALKAQSGRELQVATVASLEGYEISDYGYRLGRAWGLGTKEKNEAAILLVAPGDRKLRIEVGYGLEPVLTDGLTSLIINQAIVPKFKAGDMPGGIEAGTDLIIKQLTLPADQARRVAADAQAIPKAEGIPIQAIFFLIFFVFVIVIPLIRRAMGGRPHRSSGVGSIILWEVANAIAQGSSRSGGGGWSGGGGGGGGSSWGGGGGSFGGGGSSGSW